MAVRRTNSNDRPRPRAVSGQVDQKGRISLPRNIRDALHIEPGDTVFFDVDTIAGEFPMLRVAKAINPLATMMDALADDAIRQHAAGETVDFFDLVDDYATELKTTHSPNDR